MRLIRISDKAISDIVNSLAIEQEVAECVKVIITRYDGNYVNFVYTVLSVYMKTYVGISDTSSYLTQYDKDSVLERLSVNWSTENSVLVIDRFDLIYSNSYIDHFGIGKFNDYFYEDIYNRIENLYGDKVAADRSNDVFVAMESIFQAIESVFIRLLCIDDDCLTPYVGIHVQLKHGLLYIGLTN